MRALHLSLFTLCLCCLSCQSPEKAAIQPLPPDAAPLPYGDLVNRGKAQVAAAHEFFYQDRWDDVKKASVALNETAASLTALKPEAVPEPKRAQLTASVKELTDASNELQQAANTKDVAKTTDAFRRLHLAVRQLRPD